MKPEDIRVGMRFYYQGNHSSTAGMEIVIIDTVNKKCKYLDNGHVVTYHDGTISNEQYWKPIAEKEQGFDKLYLTLKDNGRTIDGD